MQLCLDSKVKLGLDYNRGQWITSHSSAHEFFKSRNFKNGPTKVDFTTPNRHLLLSAGNINTEMINSPLEMKKPLLRLKMNKQ